MKSAALLSALAVPSFACAQAAITSERAGPFDAASTWAGAKAPVSGSDSVVSADEVYLKTEFTIAAGETVTAKKNGRLAIGGRGHLTVAKGGRLNFDTSYMRESGAGGHFTIEAGAMAKVAKYWNNDASPSYTNEWIADAKGVTTFQVTGRAILRGTNSVLSVDLSHYDLSNGDTLILLDYGELLLQKQAAGDHGWGAIILSAGWSADLDLAYDIDGNGDLGIALTNIRDSGKASNKARSTETKQASGVLLNLGGVSFFMNSTQ